MDGTHELMVRNAVMFCVVVSVVAVALVPIVFELALGFAILEPKIAHIHGLGAALFDGFVGDADGGAVVAADMGWRLRMAHLGEGDSHWYSVLAVVKHGAGFGFGCGGDDDFEDGAVGMDGAVSWWRFIGGEGLARWIKRWTA